MKIVFWVQGDDLPVSIALSPDKQILPQMQITIDDDADIAVVQQNVLKAMEVIGAHISTALIAKKRGAA